MNIPANFKYTKEHEWILVEGSTGTIGITEYAQNELGDVVFIDIEDSLTEIVAGEKFGVKADRVADLADSFRLDRFMAEKSAETRDQGGD